MCLVGPLSQGCLQEEGLKLLLPRFHGLKAGMSTDPDAPFKVPLKTWLAGNPDDSTGGCVPARASLCTGVAA